MASYIAKFKAMLSSRRFQAAVLGIVVIVFQDVIGLDQTQSQTVAALLMSWIVGDSITKTE